MVMRYPYTCEACGAKWEVIKSVRQIDEPEHCAKCQTPGRRYISRTSFYGAAVEDAEYNPAFGCVIKNSAHRKALAKQRGMEEIGNESLDSIHAHFDGEQRRRQERHEKEIDDILDTLAQ